MSFAFRNNTATTTIAPCGCCIGTGLFPGTKVLGSQGWAPIETLRPGDRVFTLEHGMQPLRRVTRHRNWSDPQTCRMSHLPLEVPAGAIGNEDRFWMMPESDVLVAPAPDLSKHLQTALLGAPYLQEYAGIKFVRPSKSIQLLQLEFDAPEILGVAGGAWLSPAPLGALEGSELLQLTGERADAYLMLLEGHVT